MIEDANGDFVCVGIANGRYSGDSCNLNDSNYVYTNGSDKSEVFVCKFDVLGNTLFSLRQTSSRHTEAVSVIEYNSQYVVLLCQRSYAQSGYIHPTLLYLKSIGSFLNAEHFASNRNYDIVPKELIDFNGDIVVVGQISNASRVLFSSFWLVVNGITVLDYKELVHNHPYVLYNDVVSEFDTLVISASSKLNNSGNWEVQTTQKAHRYTNGFNTASKPWVCKHLSLSLLWARIK